MPHLAPRPGFDLAIEVRLGIAVEFSGQAQDIVADEIFHDNVGPARWIA
jgi:hypothetical protein